jgi:hypothetical protein
MTYALANMVSNESALRKFAMERSGEFSATKPIILNLSPT